MIHRLQKSACKLSQVIQHTTMINLLPTKVRLTTMLVYPRNPIHHIGDLYEIILECIDNDQQITVLNVSPDLPDDIFY